MTTQDMWKATNALQSWFISQSLPPHEAVQVAEMFIARLIAENATSDENLEKKLSLVNSTVRDFSGFCLLQKALR